MQVSSTQILTSLKEASVAQLIPAWQLDWPGGALGVFQVPGSVRDCWNQDAQGLDL